MISSRISSNILASRIASDIVQQQNQLAQYQTQISTGKRINTPSDDPAQAAHLLRLQEATSLLDQYQRNASAAESQLAIEEQALVGTTNALMRIRDLALSANSGVVDDYTRAANNAEVNLLLDEIYDLANTRDSFGNYLFSGTNTQVQPFTPGSPVSYNGSDDTLEIPIGLGRTIQTGDSGADTFLRIRNGNGSFQVQPTPSNTGTAIVSSGAVIDKSAFEAKNFTITFTDTDNYSITDTSDGSEVATGSYTSGTPIEFNGMRFSISGEPAAGDTFEVQPSRYQDIFSTVSSFVDALNSSPNTPAEKAQMQQTINRTIMNLDQSLDHINIARTKVGGRLNSIDNSRDDNANMKLQIERTQSEVEDIDIAEAITNLQSQATALEVLQKTYVRVQDLSLFKYL